MRWTNRREKQMRWLKLLAVLLVLCLPACQEKSGGPAHTLKEALEALEKEDYDAYLRCVDFGTEMDSMQVACMRQVLRQHVGWRRLKCPSVVSIDMIDSQMQGDSICTVYYQYTFADSTKDVGAQKMVRLGETWKIRLRN